MAFGIVKHAADGYWEHKWNEDPKVKSTSQPSLSQDTYVGYELGI